MHVAWQIQEIQCMIFDYLEPRDLARLSRTNKAFFDVATDKLWNRISTVSPFLSCLPLDYRDRQLQVEDIQRLDFYASKVKNLDLDCTDIDTIINLFPEFQRKKKREATKTQRDSNESQHSSDESQAHPRKSWRALWDDIAELRPTSNFLCNLRCLCIKEIIEDLLVPLIGISGSNLTKLHIKYIIDRESRSFELRLLKGFLKALLEGLQDSPKLEYLFVRDRECHLIPLRLIQQSPLQTLRFEPRMHPGEHRSFPFKKVPIRYEILQKSTLQHLVLGLNREWYTPMIKGRYLPRLKTIWLNLTTFKSEPCKQSCINVTTDSWTCVSDQSQHDLTTDVKFDCGRRSPILFLRGLDNPEISFLNIKFPVEVTGAMFLDVVSAAKDSCRLGNLTRLSLADGGWKENCRQCGKHPRPKIRPAELREAIDMLLPMPRLITLRISVAPNFLDILNLDLYKSITNGLPRLEKLFLGNARFAATTQSQGTTYYESVPLYHIAAFCSMLPRLVDLTVGAVDGTTLEEEPRSEWACLGVKILAITHWVPDTVRGRGGVNRDWLHQGLRTYFPNSDLAKETFDPRLDYFDQAD